jgi:integrase
MTILTQQSLPAVANGSTLAFSGDPRDRLTIREVVEHYLPHAQRTLAERSYEATAHTLGRFVAACGQLQIGACRAFDLQSWINQNPRFASDWTVKRVIGIIKRAFNWSVDMELTTRNPFARIRHRKGPRGRPMTPHEYQQILRHSSAGFRRFVVFLKFSGCRPGEAAKMKWSDVQFGQNCVKLRDHKTAKATGRPRLIPLVPTTTKLLVWLREHPQVSVQELLYRILKDGPVNAATVAKRMAAYGVSYHAVQRARRALGIVKEHYGPSGSRGRYIYTFGKKGRPPHVPQREHIFLNSEGNPWHRSSLACCMGRLRRRAPDLDNITLYGLRHLYGTRGIQNDVNLKLLSLCMGHSDVRTTEYYIAEAGLTEQVQQAALQNVYGPGAVTALSPPRPPRVVPTIATPATAEEIPATTEQLAGRHGLERKRPAVPLVVPLSEPVMPPQQATGAKLESLMQMLLSRLSNEKPPAKALHPVHPPSQLTPAQENAFRAWTWAVEQRPSLAQAKDRDVYEFLLGRPDHEGIVPPSFQTFNRYLGAARLFHDCRRRILKKRLPMPVAAKGGVS